MDNIVLVSWISCAISLLLQESNLGLAPLLILAAGQAAYCVMGLALVSSPYLLFQLFALQAALVFGFLLVRKPCVQASGIMWTSHNIRIAEWTVLLLFLFLPAANVWLGVVAGFHVFLDNLEIAKEPVYEGGLGLVRRINEGVGLFVPGGACWWQWAKGPKWQDHKDHTATG